MNGVSISTSVLDVGARIELDAATYLAPIAEAGYQLIEVSGYATVLLSKPKSIASAGLRVWAVHGELDAGAISTDERVRQRSVEEESQRLEGAGPFAPCPYVIHYLNRVHDPAAGVAFRRSVEALLRRAEVLGVTLAIETVPHKSSNERYAPSGEVAQFVHSLASPCAGICLDVNHSNLAEDLGQAAHNCNGLIANIHVSDNRGGYEDHLPPGGGVIDFASAMQAIADAGYAGPVNLEFRVPGGVTKTLFVRMREWAERIAATLARGQTNPAPQKERPGPFGAGPRPS